MGTIFLELYTCGKYLRVNCTLHFSVYTVIKICVIKYLRNWFQQRKQWFRQIIFFFFLYLVLFPNEIVSLHFIRESLIQISETILFIEIFN